MNRARINIKDINWEKLRDPSAHLRVLVPTAEQLADISEKLLTMPMFLPDEHRSQEWVDLIVATMFSGPQLNWIYEIGKWAGVVAFQDIWPGYKADVSFFLWDNAFMRGARPEQVGLRGKLCWGAEFIRELSNLADLVMGEFGLKRLGLASPDQYTVDIATRFLGFKPEGHQRHGFRWEGKTFTLHLLRRIKEGGQQCQHRSLPQESGPQAVSVAHF